MSHLPFVLESAPALRPRRASLAGPLRAWHPYAVAILAAGLGTASLVPPGDMPAMEWQLAVLLRFMAAMKALMVVGALVLTHWRMARPLPATAASGYLLGIALMAVAPGLIWSLRHVGAGAACFHAGLLVYLLTAWRDGTARPFRPAP